ncbi:MAG: hypothetical protein REI64_11880 [Pedobacter sp.]|uniref:hypothetical protein n=1 Tax=Pedobacter sp. TaxID=1411316 RepID=UPI0028080A61|nr:hypothetical protein [Pedobacter sp.]MDQ8005491.1 hypothetical protein [Pedobacter sp.]
MKKYITGVCKQVLIFTAYFIFANLFLLNRQGGTDILFFALTMLCLIIHFVIVFVRFVRSKDAVLSVGLIKVLTVLILGVLFLLFVDGYLMWMNRYGL